MARTQPQPPVIEQIVHKLPTLGPERRGEVEDFIDFLSQREDDRRLTRAAMSASEAALTAVWNNPDDAAYDQL